MLYLFHLQREMIRLSILGNLHLLPVVCMVRKLWLFIPFALCNVAKFESVRCLVRQHLLVSMKAIPFINKSKAIDRDNIHGKWWIRSEGYNLCVCSVGWLLYTQSDKFVWLIKRSRFFSGRWYLNLIIIIRKAMLNKIGHSSKLSFENSPTEIIV